MIPKGKADWLMVSFIGVVITSLGGFLWIQASYATTRVGMMSREMIEGYGVLHIKYQQADYYQAVAIAAMVLGFVLIIAGLIRMAQADR